MKKWFLILLVVSFCSCSYDKTLLVKSASVILVNTPTGNQHFVMGDTIRITGIVTQTFPITEVAVHMTDISNNSEFYHNHFLTNNKLVYDFSSVFAIKDNKPAAFKVEIEAVDIDGNDSSKDLIITIN